MRMVGQLEGKHGCMTILHQDSGAYYYQRWPTTGEISAMYGNADLQRFPWINSDWEWKDIAPTATVEERIAITQWKLLGRGGWEQMERESKS